MSDSTIQIANYRRTGVQRFDGNPFIEALPKIERSKLDFLTQLAHSPPAPTAATRRGNEIVRAMELATLNDIVYPFPEYQRAGLALTTIMRETYVARNPLATHDKQRRHALAARDEADVLLPADWKSSAKGHLILSVSGMGKTTFVQAFLLRYPTVIKHTQYQGTPLRCHQIPYLVVRVPHDGTLKSLCMQFFHEVDSLLGTDYSRQARGVRLIAPMVQLMSQVATAVSLGVLVVDEVQNLRSSRGMNAELMLNLFSEIIERLGISLLVLATPAVQRVVEGSVRNARKLVSAGQTVISPMSSTDPQWEDFCDTYWQYSYVKKKGRLDKPIRDAWYRASAGNTAFAALAFFLAQRNEIGGREIVDVAAFERVAAIDMGFLQPAIAALRSGDPDRLCAFDDLLFGKNYTALRGLLGVSCHDTDVHEPEEFEEEQVQSPPHKVTKARKRKDPEAWNDELPVEEPLGAEL
ncbi:ATP-binding protein [Ralstonia pseudosolanacearum]|uniref:ATP-binding protein n=1 Tax=Ralstonia pseudosolanacearum TaxID=1310165 RepID=UPI003AADF4E5